MTGRRMTDDAERWVILVAATICAVLGGALAHQRSSIHSGAQGFVRAAYVVLFVGVVAYAVSGLAGVAATYRVTAILAGVLMSLCGLLWDTADMIRSRPTTGPFRHVTRLLNRRKEE